MRRDDARMITPFLATVDSVKPPQGRAMGPLRLLLATLLLVGAVAGLLQLTPGCRDWRDWKAFKEGQRYITLELRSQPFGCWNL